MDNEIVLLYRPHKEDSSRQSLIVTNLWRPNLRAEFTKTSRTKFRLLNAWSDFKSYKDINKDSLKFL